METHGDGETSGSAAPCRRERSSGGAGSGDDEQRGSPRMEAQIQTQTQTQAGMVAQTGISSVFLFFLANICTTYDTNIFTTMYCSSRHEVKIKKNLHFIRN
jgi:hypothetical protein